MIDDPTGRDPAEVRDVARAWNFDAYLAATLAPAECRDDLIALAAFVGELERIRATVTEPTLAQIRIQWWRDEIQRMVRHETSCAHPVGAALQVAVARHRLAPGRLLGIADAVSDLLSAPSLNDEQRLNAWLSKRYVAPFELAIGCLDLTIDRTLVVRAGRCHGLAQLAHQCRLVPDFADQLELTVSPDALACEARALFADVRSAYRALSRRERVGVLPVSVATRYLAATAHPPSRLTIATRMASGYWFGRI